MHESLLDTCGRTWNGHGKSQTCIALASCNICKELCKIYITIDNTFNHLKTEST